jgi:hypothetical protein
LPGVFTRRALGCFSDAGFAGNDDNHGTDSLLVRFIKGLFCIYFAASQDVFSGRVLPLPGEPGPLFPRLSEIPERVNSPVVYGGANDYNTLQWKIVSA